MLKLTEKQAITLHRLAIADLKTMMGNEEAMEEVRREIKEIRKWKIYQDSEELIKKSIEALKKYNLLRAAAKAFRTDCTQCVHIENCEFRRVKDICFNYQSDSDDFNEFGQDEGKLAVYDELIKKVFK